MVKTIENISSVELFKFSASVCRKLFGLRLHPFKLSSGRLPLDLGESRFSEKHQSWLGGRGLAHLKLIG